MSRVFAAGSTESAVYDGTPPVTAAPFTVAAWARRTDTGSFRTVIGIGDKDVTNHQWYLQMYDFGSKSVKWEVQAGGTTANSTAPGNWVQNQWHHVAGVEASSTSRTCYLDGSPDATPDTTSRAPSGADRISIGKVAESSPAAGEYFTGDVAEVGVWDVALTDAEIASLAKGVTPPNIRPANLVFYAPMVRDDTVVRDLVGGLSLTLTGTSASAHPRVFRKRPRSQQTVIAIQPSGAIAATLQKALFSGSGTQTQTGTIAATLQAATAALSGTHTTGAEGTVSATMQAATASFVGAMQPSGTVAATMQPATFNGAAAQVLAGAIAAELQNPTFAATGTQTIAGTIAAALTKALFTGAGAQAQTGTITATLQEPTATLVGVMQPSGTIVSTLAYPLFTGTALVGNTRMAYSVYIDLDGTILLSDDTDVAGNVIGEGRGVGNVAVHVERGHDVARVLSPPVAGLARFTLDNVDGTYDIGTDLRAGLLTRVEATYLSTRYPLFTGILDHPTRSQPDVRLPYVTVEVLGRLARLAGINVSTGLYADITTSDAIGYLLDAAGFPKNAPAYLDSLTPAGGWNLDSTSGDDPDTSGNGNDAVITLGSGVRGDTAIEDGGTLSTDFDGANTRFAVAADAAINDHFATGGLTLAFINADSDGESDTGIILSKGYEFYVSDQSGSAMRLQFVQGFSTTAGSWRTTDRVITVGTNYLVAVYYDRTTGTSADPTMWVCDLDAETYTKLTVGSGLTEVSTPSGTVTTDTATGLQIGGASGGSRCFDGNIGSVRVYGDVGDVTYWEPLIKTASVRASNAPRHIDDGLTTMDWWWLDSEDALQALETLKNTEGPGAALYEDATGALVFKNRHARSTEARSSTVQTTFTDSAEPRPSSPLTYDPGLKDVINRCEIEVVRRSAQALGEVWALGETVIIAAGETKMFVARASDPFKNAATPSSGAGDYTVSTGTLTTISLDRTSGAQVTITLYSASGCTITGLRLRAESVEVVNTTTITHSVDMSTSQEAYGVSTYRLPTRREIPAPTAQSFADAVVSYYQDGRPTLRMTVESNFDDDRKTAVLTREVGDRVHVTIGDDLDADFWIEHVEHNINTMSVHDTVFSLTEANEVVSYFVLGTSQLNGTDVLTF